METETWILVLAAAVANPETAEAEVERRWLAVAEFLDLLRRRFGARECAGSGARGTHFVALRTGREAELLDYFRSKLFVEKAALDTTFNFEGILVRLQRADAIDPGAEQPLVIVG